MHTPGPWRLVHSVGGWTDLLAQDDSLVCRFDDRGPSKANALLIAAAPDLLEALEQIEKGEGRFSRDSLTHCAKTVEDMKAIAQTAIAKAKGEAVEAQGRRRGRGEL